MALDGFSMGNLGLQKELTSAQMANQAEQLAQKGSELKIKDVSKIADGKKIKLDEDDSESKNQFNDGFKKDSEEDEDSQEDEDTKDYEDMNSGISVEEFESRHLKEISVRINPKTEMVELFSNTNNKIIETMSADDLMTLLSKLNSASGILVNRKI